MSPKDEIIFFY